VTTRRRPEPRLVAYGLAAAASLVAALVLGRGALLVVAVPLLVLAAIGASDRTSPLLDVTVDVGARRATQGDQVAVELRLRTGGAARHDLRLVPDRAWRPVRSADIAGNGVHRAAPDAGEVVVVVELEAAAWGRHPLGTLHVRSRRRWGLLVWDAVVPLAVDVRVLPPITRLSRLLPPADPAGMAGPHRSRARGHGSDIAELRPYQPGDRLRDVSWAATARSGQPWVAEHHPERTGTVVLLLDTLGDGTGPGAPAFDRAAAATWSLVSAHLRVGDRVGLLGTGPSITWVPPGSGRRARLLILDALLALAGPRPRQRTGGRGADTRALLPTDALVLGVTMLQSDAFVAALARQRRHGRTVQAIVLDATTCADEDADVTVLAAHRLWRAELDARRATLSAAGVPSALVAGPGDVPAALRALARRPVRPRLRRAR
jgi:uncharacterized protein (DUF58 family)